ncbi:hypothetical protein [Microbulbifer taiwanensis]|uniref:NusG domain-containing protein n=1 Tax=Microbulbifer taiwanensis TaxID=986746 RepID=A0ABW1YSJ9_9GAMM|nr:hypothetical protein [Microbulbifer taiwanensis]
MKGGYRVRTKGDRILVLFLSFLMIGILYQALDPVSRHLSSFSDLRNGRYLQVNGILEKFYSPNEIHSGNLYLVDSEGKKNILRVLKIDRSPKGGCINRGIKNVAGLVGKQIEVKYKLISYEACILSVEISE